MFDLRMSGVQNQMIELFLICALSLPSTNFTRPAIVSYHAAIRDEKDLMEDLKKHREIDDVFITPKGQADKLREHGWEQLPFSINDKEVWIQRRPKSDKKIKGAA